MTNPMNEIEAAIASKLTYAHWNAHPSVALPDYETCNVCGGRREFGRGNKQEVVQNIAALTRQAIRGELEALQSQQSHGVDCALCIGSGDCDCVIAEIDERIKHYTDPSNNKGENHE